VCWHKVSDEEENRHDNVLCDGDNVRTRDLENLDASLDAGIEVNVVRADAGGNADLQVLGLRDEVGGEVARVKGRRNVNFGVLDVLLKIAIRALFAARYDELVSPSLEELREAEPVLNGTEQTRLLLGSLVTVVEDSENLDHGSKQ